ncbi:hypothetical protein HMF8227_02363 [Saliniradius amylolyticus]|uniref:Uncharacterized protein n=1 Tax=Saliniradius amylolyticus TaxID=2183582 RepID=A0A2S2E583_9ALTE|nr:hypothetical protein [Saliniradius amylolyticus]AWL12815.1 hypothetical protein HMF8227_02363 [Saliniradius amylolyticus]
MEQQLSDLKVSFDEHRKEVTSLMKSLIELQTKQAQHDEQDRKLFEIYTKLSDRVRAIEITAAARGNSVSNNERLVWLLITGAVGSFFWFVR